MQQKYEEITRKLELLEQKLKEKDEKIVNLEKKVDELKGSGTNISYADLFSNKKKASEAQVVMAAQVVKVSQQLDKIASNVVVMGLKESDSGDQEKVDALVTKLELRTDTVASFKRLRKGGSSTSSVNSGTAAGSSQRPAVLLIQFKSSEIQAKALRNSKNLKGDVEFGSVFVNKDRIKEERVADEMLRKERNSRNSKLENVETGGKGRRYREKDGRKVCWGIRVRDGSSKLEWVELSQ